MGAWRRWIWLVPAITVFLPGAVRAGDSLKFSHNNNPGHPIHEAAVRFAEVVSRRSNGEVQVAIFPSSQLGRMNETWTGVKFEGPVLLLVMPPLLAPGLGQMGVDPVHFGVVFILAVGIGLYTPPVGVALYAVQRFTGCEFGEVVSAVLPWLLPLVAALFVVTLVPWLTLAIPRAFGF